MGRFCPRLLNYLRRKMPGVNEFDPRRPTPPRTIGMPDRIARMCGIKGVADRPRPAPKQTPLCLLKIKTAADQRHGYALIGHDLQRAAAETVTQKKTAAKRHKGRKKGEWNKKIAFLVFILFCALCSFLRPCIRIIAPADGPSHTPRGGWRC